MKRVVYLNDLKESDIRPENTYNEYKEFLSKDIKNYFPAGSHLIDIDCPGCLSKNYKFAFKKMGFDYQLCTACGSLFVSPRPPDTALRLFYKNSNAGVFLRNIFLGNNLEARSEKVLSYRTQWITGLLEEYVPEAKIFLDYATRSPTFFKELNALGVSEKIISVLPECFEQEKMFPENVTIIGRDEKADEAIKNTVDIMTAFEVLERIFDPLALFTYAYGACKKNGLFFISSTTASGFEYQVLGEHSPNIIPLDRMNLLSLEALTKLIEKAGFEIIELSTPGRLDVEIVKKTFEKNPDLAIEPFWKYLFCCRNDAAWHALQEYLQQFQLSSHICIAAIKR